MRCLIIELRIVTVTNKLTVHFVRLLKAQAHPPVFNNRIPLIFITQIGKCMSLRLLVSKADDRIIKACTGTAIQDSSFNRNRKEAIKVFI